MSERLPSFRPRLARWRGGLYGVSFLPAAGSAVLKAIRRVVRNWGLQRRSDKGLFDIARMFNPYIRGWVSYFSHFYKSALYPTLRRIDAHVLRWVARKFKRFDRSVLAFWVGCAAVELMPVWQRMREILLGSPRLFVDETRAPVLGPGRTKTGYFWSIARDDGAWRGGTDPPTVIYTCAPGRGAKEPPPRPLQHKTDSPACRDGAKACRVEGMRRRGP